MMVILNSSLLILFLMKLKGGSGLAFFWTGVSMSPAQRIICQGLKTWRWWGGRGIHPYLGCRIRASGKKRDPGLGLQRLGGVLVTAQTLSLDSQGQDPSWAIPLQGPALAELGKVSQRSSLDISVLTRDRVGASSHRDTARLHTTERGLTRGPRPGCLHGPSQKASPWLLP